MADESYSDAKLSKIIADLTDYIDQSHCGYCKAILGDAKTIISSYGKIQEEAIVMDKLQHDRNEMLVETQKNAVSMIQKYMPQEKPDDHNWSMIPRRSNGPGQRVKNNRFVQWAFGDFFEGLF